MKLKANEILLLRSLVYERSCTKEEIELLTEGMDLDESRIEYPLLLSVLGNRTDWEYFPAGMIPRLEGIYRSIRLRNIYGIPWLKEKLEILKENGIKVMFLKGMAMRAYYAPSIPRQMSDFDMAVPPDRFKDAKVLISKGEEDTGKVPALHSEHIGTGESKTIDLHHWIFKTNSDVGSIWERALDAQYQDYDVKIPEPMDMFIHIVHNKVRDDVLGTYQNRRLKWLYDLALIITKTGIPDWDLMAERAKELKSSIYMKYALPDFAKVFPEMLDEETLQRLFPQDEEYNEVKKLFDKFSYERQQYKDIRIKGSRLDPRRIYRIVRYWRLSYKCFFKRELEENGETKGFLDYIMKRRNVRNVPELIRYYFRKNR